MHSVLGTYLEVYRVLFRHRALLVRFGVVMCVAVTGFWALCTYVIGWSAPALPVDPQPWVYATLGLWFSVLLAVRWHRFVLLDERQIGLLDIWPRRREFWFLARLIVILLAVGVLFYLFILMLVIPMNLKNLAASMLGGQATDGRFLSAMSTLSFPILQSAAYAFGLARLGLILPAVAVDRPLNARESWQATTGRGLPFFTLILLVNLPMIILDSLSWFVYLPEIVSLALYMAVWWVTIAATATALSFNYVATIGRPNDSAVAPTP